jgi:hypothetical protein
MSTPERTPPIEWVSTELEKLGYTLDDVGPIGVKLFVLGFTMGRDTKLEEEAVRTQIQALFPRKEME